MIITISREFGSGGRELGKRLSEALRIPCYDHTIIEMISKENGLNSDYVARVSEKRSASGLSANDWSALFHSLQGDGAVYHEIYQLKKA